jgi:SNF2 family DNA or RNA helicase
MIAQATHPNGTVLQAVLFLAGRCDGARSQDGAGFNRYDAQFGHALADRIAAGQGVNLQKALRVVSKYRKQLEKGGIILPEKIEEPPPPPPPSPSDRLVSPPRDEITVSRVGSMLQIAFAYDPALVEKARSLPSRRWDPASKCWTAPADALPAILAAFPEAVLTGDLEAERLAKAKADRDEASALAARLASETAAYEAFRPSLGLYAHQDEGARWLLERRHAIVADDMGLGKTREALAAARATGLLTFVVAPAGLRINWLREAEAVDHRIEIFSWAKVPVPPDVPFVLIADEAHYAQNIKAARTKRFLELAKKAEAVYLLTGTPIKNGRPVNLFPLLVAVKHELARDKGAFERHYCAAGPTRWTKWDTSGAAHLDELHRNLADVVLRRMKGECLDLPEKVRVLRRAELSDEARQTYDTKLHEMQAEYRRRKALGEIGEADALVLMNHLRHAGSLAKVESAVELAEEVVEQGGQVVLFTAFQDSAGQLADALDAGKITGAQDADERTKTIDAFQAGQIKTVVCTLGAGNVGITLTAAQTVILVDRPWTPGDAVQAEDRLHRIGQKGSVLAVWLQANGADEAIDALLQQKHERIELVLSGKRKTLRGLGSVSDVAEAILGE